MKIISRKLLQRLSKNSSRWTSTITKPPSTLAPRFCEEFKDFYPKILDKALNETKYIIHRPNKENIKEMCEHFMLYKFPMQGEFFMYAYEMLEKPENITNDKLRQAYYIACASELIRTYFIFHDDVYDNRKTHAGRQCWHLTPNAGPLALNNTLMLRSFINELLKPNLEMSLYHKITDFYNEVYLDFEMGQYLNFLVSATQGSTSFNMDAYEKIIRLKASFYSMKTPILLALIMLNKASEASIELVTYMCNNLGILFQVHSDLTEYLNVDESLSLKSKIDIINGKCASTAVMALKHLNSEQRKVFNECFKSSDPKKIERIIELYDQVNLRELYRKEKKASYNIFMEKLRKLPPDSVPSPEFFENVLRYFQNYASNISRYHYI